MFRGKCIQGLKRLYRSQGLKLPDDIPDRDAFERLLTESCTSDWVVYSKAPFAGPEVVLKYLARYTHRVAIGNSRLVSLEGNRVSFTYRDYADDGARKVTTLSADHFLTRFLLHVVPKGFVRIRHYGFLSHAKKRHSLACIRELFCVGHLQRKYHPIPIGHPRVPAVAVSSGSKYKASTCRQPLTFSAFHSLSATGILLPVVSSERVTSMRVKPLMAGRNLHLIGETLPPSAAQP